MSLSFMFFSESLEVKATMLFSVSSRRAAAASVNPAQRGSNTWRTTGNKPIRTYETRPTKIVAIAACRKAPEASTFTVKL